MRHVASNLLTAVATLALLAVLTLPARAVLRGSHHEAPPPPRATLAQRMAGPPPARAFGVYVDPWHEDVWSHAVGGAPQLIAKFESFSRRRSLEPFLTQVAHDGIHQALVSWEPWEPVPARLGITLQYLPQPGYRNAEIAAGAQDAYIRAFARSLRGFDGTVWLRYAHEMNGIWYPWSHGPVDYVRAWRHVVTLVRSIAPNARFVWSANPSLYVPASAWRRELLRYWPGSHWVDAVGSTMIDFGGRKTYPVARFVPRLRALRRLFGKPIMLAEVNTDADGRLVWLDDLRRMLDGMPWITAVIWSQLPSRGTAQMRGAAGVLNWDVQRDPPAAARLAGIIRDGRR